MVPASGGVSPSGKATVFGTVIPRFESWHPSQIFLQSYKANTLRQSVSGLERILP